ncbi:hypothetical protein [Rugosimonospora africana]|uniref:hypothetical protein n=1 Tax=Rugosimonospora africana TaxID=556532 RepID=UPI001943822D|nr:hypothetical protein [Rugosimonospora africana]
MTTQIIFAHRPPCMQIMTGLSQQQADQLVADVYAAGGIDPAPRRTVGPYRTVLMVLIHLRQHPAPGADRRTVRLLAADGVTVDRPPRPDHHHGSGAETEGQAAGGTTEAVCS